MLKFHKKVVCLVERGWAGTRRMTLSLAGEKVPSVCFIKGRPGKDVRDIITGHKEISLRFIGRHIFKPCIVMVLSRNFFLRNTVCVVMDNRKNYGWVRAINNFSGVRTILIDESKEDYLLYLDNQRVDIKYILDLAKGQR